MKENVPCEHYKREYEIMHMRSYKFLIFDIYTSNDLYTSNDIYTSNEVYTWRICVKYVDVYQSYAAYAIFWPLN